MCRFCLCEIINSFWWCYTYSKICQFELLYYWTWTLIWQLISKKENFEFKPAVLCLKINWINTTIGFSYQIFAILWNELVIRSLWIHYGNFIYENPSKNQPVSLYFRICQLHLCRGVRTHSQLVFWIWH